MNCRENRAQLTPRILLGFLLKVGLCVGLTLWTGCGGSDKPEADGEESESAENASDGPSSTAGPDALSNPQVPMAESGAAALDVLQEMVETANDDDRGVCRNLSREGRVKG